jgi:hypothetical protein
LPRKAFPGTNLGRQGKLANLLGRCCVPDWCSVSTQAKERQEGYDDDDGADDVNESVHERSLQVDHRRASIGPLDLHSSEVNIPLSVRKLRTTAHTPTSLPDGRVVCGIARPRPSDRLDQARNTSTALAPPKAKELESIVRATTLSRAAQGT